MKRMYSFNIRKWSPKTLTKRKFLRNLILWTLTLSCVGLYLKNRQSAGELNREGTVEDVVLVDDSLDSDWSPIGRMQNCEGQVNTTGIEGFELTTAKQKENNSQVNLLYQVRKSEGLSRKKQRKNVHKTSSSSKQPFPDLTERRASRNNVTGRSEEVVNLIVKGGRGTRDVDAFLAIRQQNLTAYLRKGHRSPGKQWYSPAPAPGGLPAQRLPQALITGVKEGTMTLLRYLSMHPHIVPVIKSSAQVSRSFHDQTSLDGTVFQSSGDEHVFANLAQTSVQNKPSYFWQETAPGHLHALNPFIKLLLVLRDPVERLRLLLQTAKLSGSRVPEDVYVTHRGGETRVDNQSTVVQEGIYVTYLKKWMKFFPLAQLYVTDLRALDLSPAEEMKKIQVFLGIPHQIDEKNFPYNIASQSFCIQPFHLRKALCPKQKKSKPGFPLSLSSENLLHDFYRPYNEQLFSVLRRRFPWPAGHADTSAVT